MAYANDAALHLLRIAREPRFRESSLWGFVEPAHQGELKAQLNDALEKRQVTERRLQRFKRSDGTPVELEVTACFMEWEGDSAVQLVIRTPADGDD